MEPEIRTGIGSEGGHWYVPGPPTVCAYEIKGANGNWRSTNLRDARKHGWFPGVTTITRIPASPGLERWKVRQAIYAALTHPDALLEQDADKLIKLIEDDSKEQGKKAAEEGTAIHAAIEGYFQTGTVHPDFAKHIKGVRQALFDLVGDDDRRAWNTETACTHPYGFGTRIDLYSVDHGVVVDFKTKEFKADDKVTVHPEQAMQLAACREMIMPSARTVNLFISRSEPGLVRAVEWSSAESAKAWREFQLILKFWQSRNNMEPR